MSKTMPRGVGNDFSASSVLYLFEELYQSAHDHSVRTAFPADQDGEVGDIVIVDLTTAVYICTKTSRGWFKTAALTAV